MALIGMAAVGIAVLAALTVAAVVGAVEADERNRGDRLSDLTMTVFWTVLAAELLFAGGGFLAGVV